MKVTPRNNEDLTLSLTLSIEKSDYAEKQKKLLNDYRRKADLKGFRKGMAPMSIIEKIHGRSALLDAVNGLISEGLNNYITENKLNIIGEPLPGENGKDIDWDNDTEFEFVFDLAPAPEFELNLSKEDKIIRYDVDISEQEKNKYMSNLLKQYGELKEADLIEEEDFIIADLIQGDKKIERSYISLKTIGNAREKKKFLGKKVGDQIIVNVNKTFENEADRAALLKVKKEDLTGMDPEYTVEVKEVKRFRDAEPAQELFDRIYGPGVVTSQEEFESRVSGKMAEDFSQEADFRFVVDAREALIEKAGIRLPENFLKRWLFSVNEGKFSMEEIEKDFALFIKDFRWQMIKGKITKEHNLQVAKEDLLEHARKVAAYQFAMYGLHNAPAEQLDRYAESLLSNEKEQRRIFEKAEEDKVIEYVKSVVTLKGKKISYEELQKMTN
jgi:trigger factor